MLYLEKSCTGHHDISEIILARIHSLNDRSGKYKIVQMILGTKDIIRLESTSYTTLTIVESMESI